MKPKPLEALNHFTVPCSFTSHPRVRNSDRVGVVDIGIAMLLLARSWEPRHGFPGVAKSFHPKKKPQRLFLQHPRTSQKVLQEQQTLVKEYHKVLSLSTATGGGRKLSLIR